MSRIRIRNTRNQAPAKHRNNIDSQIAPIERYHKKLVLQNKQSLAKGAKNKGEAETKNKEEERGKVRKKSLSF